MRNETAVQIEVRVQPRSKRNAIEALPGQSVKAYVTAPPEGGKANEALIALLAKALGVAKGACDYRAGPPKQNQAGEDRRAYEERCPPTAA